MLGHQLTSLLRPSFMPTHAARRAPLYENQRYRSRNYKNLAKIARKAAKRAQMGSAKDPRATGEELPPFFMPQRYKLLFKTIEAQKNSSRIGRKPMPQELKKEFAEHSKEYHAFKNTERAHLDREINAQLKVQITAMDAIIYLPDYLMEECLGESGETLQDEMHEFRPSVLYMEQMLRLYPQEISCKWKLYPAFEESLMRIEESQNAEEGQNQ